MFSGCDQGVFIVRGKDLWRFSLCKQRVFIVRRKHPRGFQSMTRDVYSEG